MLTTQAGAMGGGNHKVSSVQLLHDDAFSLYNNIVIGGSEYSADSIINRLNDGINILKNTWKGKDANVQIDNVIRVHNAMVEIRNTLVAIAMTTSGIAAGYRDIQNSNGAGLEAFTTINAEARSGLAFCGAGADTIDITEEANKGRAKISAARVDLLNFITKATEKYNNIMSNWTQGTGRDQLVSQFERFIAGSKSYSETLLEVIKSIETALKNYNIQ